MSSNKNELQQVLAAVEALSRQVSQLDQRVAELDTALALIRASGDHAAGARAHAADAAAESERVNEELVLTISAAIAAYLGVKPRIRQIRLLESAAWAQHGRATIQASHAITTHHG